MPAPPVAKAPHDPEKPVAKPSAKSPMVKAMEKLGLRRDIDLALHLPLRYEDETRITPLSAARDGATVQFEATVVSSEVSLRPRRQLLVVVRDGGQTCTLRFFNFYPSMHKQMAVGNLLRVRGEVRGGLLGWTMVHPVVSGAGAPLPSALTPVYPTSAGLPQAYLRKAIAGALGRVDLTETIAQELLPEAAADRIWSLRKALQFLHHPRPDVRLATLEATAIPPGNGSSSKSCWPSNCRSCSRGDCVPACARRPCTRKSVACATVCWPLCHSSSPMRSAAYRRKLPSTWPGRFRCTGCCRGMSVRARRWLPRWRRRSASMRATSAP